MTCGGCGETIQQDRLGFYSEADAGNGWASKKYQCREPGSLHVPVPPENVSGPVHYVHDSDEAIARDNAK